MTTRYIDPTLVATTATYDPTTRSSTGGSDLAYSTLKSCQLDTTNDDEIIFREGHELAVTQSLFTETGLAFTVYEGESYVCEADVPSIWPFISSGINCYVNAAGGSLEFKNDDAGTAYGAFRITGDGSWTRDLILDSNNYIISHISGLTCTQHHYNTIFRQSARNTNARTVQFDVVTPTITYHNPVFDGIGLQKINTDCNLTINHPLFLGVLDKPFIDTVSPCLAGWTMHNPIAIGCNVDNQSLRSINCVANILTISGGVAHESINAPYTLPHAGVVGTYNNDKLIKIEGGAEKAYVALCFWDSSHIGRTTGTLGALVDYQAEADSRGVKLSYFPDDHYTAFGALTVDRARAFINAGHCFGMVGQSGGDSWQVDAPLQIQYTGAGVASLTISDDGETWTVTDSTDGSSPFVYNASSGGDDEYMMKATVGIMIKINTLTNFSAGYNVAQTASGYDDAHARGIAGGTHDLSGGGIQTLAWDSTRWYDLEIVQPARYLENLIGNGFKFKDFHARGSLVTADLKSALIADGFTTAMGDADDFLMMKMATIDPMQQTFGVYQDAVRTMFKGTTSAYDLLSDVDKQSRLLSSAKRLASWLFANGGYTPILLSHTELWTNEDFGWLIDALIAAGITIVPQSDVVILAGTNVSNINTGYIQAEGSEGLGTGDQWWTGPNPQGRDSEPFSNIDMDSGPSQSLLSPYHPSNL